MKKENLEKLVEEGLSIREIASCVGLSCTPVRYWLRKFGLNTQRAKDRNPHKPKPMPPCANCGVLVRRRHNKYCSLPCQFQFKRRYRIENDFEHVSTRALKSHLLDLRGRCCEVCGITEWMGRAAPLELDHKDGNPFNNDLLNLRLICPNCHSQTQTYKNRNMGRGRFYRRRRYAEGKSH